MSSDDVSQAGPTEWGEGKVGLGPWVEEYPSRTLPTEPHWDPTLLAEGDRRNVVDKYRYMTREAIVADLDLHRHDFHIAIENLEHDANIGTIVRTANATLAAEVHIVGKKRWNRRGAMVTDRYQHIRHHESIDVLVAHARQHDLPIIAVDNTGDAVPIDRFAMPKKCILLCGQEGNGLSPAAQQAADHAVFLRQFGSTRSINVGVAAGVVMYEWIRQHG